MHHVKDNILLQYFSNISNLTIFVLKIRKTACNCPAQYIITVFRQQQTDIEGVQERSKSAQIEIRLFFFSFFFY